MNKPLDTLITNQKILNSDPPIIGTYIGQVMKNSSGQTVPNGQGEFWEYDKFDRSKDKLILKGKWVMGKLTESEDPTPEDYTGQDVVLEHYGYIGPKEDGVHSGSDGGKSKRKRKRSNKKYNKKTKRKRTRRSRR